MKPHPPDKCHAVALEFVSGADRRNERRPKIFKIEVPIFRKKKMQTVFITIGDQN
jgi:hypothetical protein